MRHDGCNACDDAGGVLSVAGNEHKVQRRRVHRASFKPVMLVAALPKSMRLWQQQEQPTSGTADMSDASASQSNSYIIAGSNFLHIVAIDSAAAVAAAAACCCCCCFCCCCLLLLLLMLLLQLLLLQMLQNRPHFQKLIISYAWPQVHEAAE